MGATGERVAFLVTVPVNEWSAYAEFTAAVFVPQTCYVKDLKSPGTGGGGSSATTIHTRDLTTLNTDGSVVSGSCGWASLATNQITLSAGTYFIDFEAPVAGVINQSQSFLYNVTDATYPIEGRAGITQAGVQNVWSRGIGTLTLTTPKIFEIRTYTTAAIATNGLGFASIAGSTPATVETYTQVKITKIRDIQ